MTAQQVGRPNLDWMDAGCCRAVRGFTELRERDQLEACGRCPVVGICAEWAITHVGMPDKNDHMVMGGLTAPERRQLVRAMRRKPAAA